MEKRREGKSGKRTYDRKENVKMKRKAHKR